MFLVFHFFVVIPGHNLGNSQVSVYRTIGPTLVFILTGIKNEKTKSVITASRLVLNNMPQS